MKVNYLFPVFQNDNAKNFFKNFCKTNFFKKHENYKLIFCCLKDDKNLKYLKEQSKNNKKIKILIFDKNFTYNDAFDASVQFFDGDIVLLGDLKIEKIDFVFEKCLEKHKSGAQVVHIVKKHTGIKDFFTTLSSKIYNFFIKIFTNKRDRLNIISLGLIDKNIIDLFKVLPQKRCFLKNTKDLMGFETRSVYVSSKTITYKPNFRVISDSLKTVLTNSIFFLLSLVLLIVLNCVLNVSTFVNVLLISMLFINLVLISLFLPKHIFDVRNFKTKKVDYKIKEIN